MGFLFALFKFFADFLQLGAVLTAPFEMKLWPDRRSREPDILFIAREHLDRLEEGRLAGPADLIVEVISDDSLARDRSEKFYEYQDAGVREYWLLDPRPNQERADFWVLDARGRYQPVPVGDDGIYRSTVLLGFWMRVDWLLSEEPPDVLQAFAAIVGLPTHILDELREKLRHSL